MALGGDHPKMGRFFLMWGAAALFMISWKPIGLALDPWVESLLKKKELNMKVDS